MGNSFHEYSSRIEWTGNRGLGTQSYRGYNRNWSVKIPGKPEILCSNDPLLGGDPKLHNPEDLLLSALSACHMLWYLHLASVSGVSVEAYLDDPVGVGETTPEGAGRFIRATLRPLITLSASSDRIAADQIHGRIHDVCFIARSVNFPVTYEARYLYG